MAGSRIIGIAIGCRPKALKSIPLRPWAALAEARQVLDVTQRHRWLGHTDAALAEIAALRGERALAADLFASARERYATAQDAGGVATVEQRLSAL